MMKMKATAIAAAIAIAVGGVVPVTANATGIPVVDAANLQQGIARYMQLIEQLKQLQAQLEQAKQQYQSITGGRGMGGLSRNDNNDVATNWQQTLSRSQQGQIASLASQIKATASKLNDSFYLSRDGQVKQSLDGRMDDAANAVARNANVFEETAKRQNRLKDLADQVNSTADLKAVSDLQARIQSEQVMATNQLLRFQSMNAMVENQRRVEHQSMLQGATFFNPSHTNR